MLRGDKPRDFVLTIYQSDHGKTLIAGKPPVAIACGAVPTRLNNSDDPVTSNKAERQRSLLSEIGTALKCLRYFTPYTIRVKGTKRFPSLKS